MIKKLPFQNNKKLIILILQLLLSIIVVLFNRDVFFPRYSISTFLNIDWTSFTLLWIGLILLIIYGISLVLMEIKLILYASIILMISQFLYYTNLMVLIIIVINLVGWYFINKHSVNMKKENKKDTKEIP